MLTKALSMAAIAAAVSACTALPPHRMAAVGEPRALATAPAPITFDGHVAGQATDYVFVLVPDARPSTPGLALGAGETLRLVMPAAFKRNGSVMISADTDANLVLTKGWPQGAVRLAGQYRVGYDEQANTLVVTASRAIATDGANAPGIKVIHLRGRTFVNPMPGDYPVSVIHAAADGRPLATWQGALRVLDDAPSARLAPTHFHVQPGANADHQQVASGQVAPLALGLLLWGEQGAALDGVGIAPRDLARYPKYTGGLLVQDSNRDRKLDPATDKVGRRHHRRRPARSDRAIHDQSVARRRHTDFFRRGAAPCQLPGRRQPAQPRLAGNPVQGRRQGRALSADLRADPWQQLPVHDRGNRPLRARRSMREQPGQRVEPVNHLMDRGG